MGNGVLMENNKFNFKIDFLILLKICIKNIIIWIWVCLNSHFKVLVRKLYWNLIKNNNLKNQLIINKFLNFFD